MSKLENKDTWELNSYGKSKKLRPIIKGLLILGVISSTVAMLYNDNTKSEYNLKTLHLPEQELRTLNIPEPKELELHLPEPKRLELHLPKQEFRTLILPDDNNVAKINKDNITIYSNGKIITEEDMNRKSNNLEGLINKDFSPKG